MPAEKISLDNAKQDKLFYVMANVVVYRAADQRCLILKRDPREKVHPGKYAVPGGKLEWHDLDIQKPTRMNGDVLDFENAIEDLLQREVLEEAASASSRSSPMSTASLLSDQMAFPWFSSNSRQSTFPATLYSSEELLRSMRG